MEEAEQLHRIQQQRKYICGKINAENFFVLVGF